MSVWMNYVQRRRPGQHRYCHQAVYHLVSCKQDFI